MIIGKKNWQLSFAQRQNNFSHLEHNSHCFTNPECQKVQQVHTKDREISNSNYIVSLPIHSKHLFHISFFYFILGLNITKKIWAFSFFSFLSFFFPLGTGIGITFPIYSSSVFSFLSSTIESNCFYNSSTTAHCTEEANALTNDSALSPFIDLKSIECDTFYTKLFLSSRIRFDGTQFWNEENHFLFFSLFSFKSKAKDNVERFLFSSSQKSFPYILQLPHEKKNQNKWSYSFPAIYLRWDRLKLFLCWFFHVFN